MNTTIIDEKGTSSMFKDTQAFSSFSTDDIPKAKDFYAQTLGLSVSDDQGLLTLHIAGGGHILIYPKTHHTPATFTVLNFPVENIEQALEDLTERGVRFEIYNAGDTKTDEKGIFRYGSIKQAWFKDPGGNVLSVIEAGE